MSKILEPVVSLYFETAKQFIQHFNFFKLSKKLFGNLEKTIAKNGDLYLIEKSDTFEDDSVFILSEDKGFGIFIFNN